MNVEQLLAYVDPGTGALIVQVLIAGVVAGVAFFTNVFQRVGMAYRWLLVRLGLKRAEPVKVPLGTEGSAPPPGAP